MLLLTFSFPVYTKLLTSLHQTILLSGINSQDSAWTSVPFHDMISKTAGRRNIMEKQYACIDLKSYYASVECVDRGLDPMTTNLVVADIRRTEKTICLAVTPSLKAHIGFVQSRTVTWMDIALYWYLLTGEKCTTYKLQVMCYLGILLRPIAWETAIAMRNSSELLR